MPGDTMKEPTPRAHEARALRLPNRATAERDRAIADHLDAMIVSTRRPRALRVIELDELDAGAGVGPGTQVSPAAEPIAADLRPLLGGGDRD